MAQELNIEDIIRFLPVSSDRVCIIFVNEPFMVNYESN